MKKEFRDALYLLSWPINRNHFLVKPSHGAKRFGLFAELFLFISTRYTKIGRNQTQKVFQTTKVWRIALASVAQQFFLCFLFNIRGFKEILNLTF